MKKKFTILGACAVAVSMLAFSGCDLFGTTAKNPDVIPGNYQEKTPEQTAQVIEKIDVDKLLNKDESGMVAANMGFEANYNASMSFMGMDVSSAHFWTQYKENVAQTDVAGAGQVRFDATIAAEGKSGSMTFSGEVWNTAEWSYASFNGWLDDKKIEQTMNYKVNLASLAGMAGSMGGISPAMDFVGPAKPDDATSLISKATELGVTIAIDDSDGVKIKISVDKDTLWTVARYSMAQQGMPEENITHIITEAQKSITINAFSYDAYFSIDKNGKFSEAKTVLNVDIKIDKAFIELMMSAMPGIPGMPSSPAPADVSSTPEITDFIFKISGTTKTYLHNDKIVVPSAVINDPTFVDVTNLTGNIPPSPIE